MINIQNEVQKIHHQYGMSEMANYKIQLLCEQYAKDYHKNEVKKLNIPDVVGTVALLKFLKEEQQKKYADAKDYMTANQHQYYEEGCDAVLQLIEMRFGNLPITHK